MCDIIYKIFIFIKNNTQNTEVINNGKHTEKENDKGRKR